MDKNRLENIKDPLVKAGLDCLKKCDQRGIGFGHMVFVHSFELGTGFMKNYMGSYTNMDTLSVALVKYEKFLDKQLNEVRSALKAMKEDK